ncbi:hypothetical protein J8J14_07420 [Roseomonas sp. SSH11]|uniref:Lipoprotein SmpA/OmlA domain-containing protein n=1 Tax=Pararoseomonas baculiformis TaxID=2820812 RepID=A0ABS4ADJ1_9PROT|nr:hypothetical protein [Pararoseomonas baculiformis]MBP0444610.1 hypothetical protein [Pararoseomonas baculiformis]
MGPAKPASPGAVLRACLLASCLPAALASCAPAGPDSAASRVLEEVLESHRASIAGVSPPPSAPTPPGLRRVATGNIAPRQAAPGSVAALVGKTPDSVLATLGQPTRRRPEGNAEIWLYQGTHCALDLVLYREASTPRVAWAAARASGTESRTEARCLSELVAG